MDMILNFQEICKNLFLFRALNHDQDRLRHDVFSNYALAQEDEASLGIPNFAGLPNNPYYASMAYFKDLYDSQKDYYKTYKFKSEQNREWAQSLAEGTYVSKIN